MKQHKKDDRLFLRIVRGDASARFAFLLLVGGILFALAMDAKVYFVGSKRFPAGNFAPRVTVLLLPALSIPFIWLLNRQHRMRSLLRHGRATEGRVIRIAESGAESGNAVVATFEWETMTYEVRVFTARTPRGLPFKAGSNVTVLFDPENPRNATIREIFLP